VGFQVFGVVVSQNGRRVYSKYKQKKYCFIFSDVERYYSLNKAGIMYKKVSLTEAVELIEIYSTRGKANNIACVF